MTLAAPPIARRQRRRALVQGASEARKEGDSGPKRPDPAFLHGIARAGVMELLVDREPRIVEAFASVMSDDGGLSGGDVAMLDRLATELTPRLPFAWLRFELERAFSAFAWYARIQRRVPPAGPWFDSATIVQNA